MILSMALVLVLKFGLDKKSLFLIRRWSLLPAFFSAHDPGNPLHDVHVVVGLAQAGLVHPATLQLHSSSRKFAHSEPNLRSVRTCFFST